MVWELYTDEPVINLRLLANPQLRIGTTLNAVIGFVLFGSSFALPQWTETLLGYPAFQAGLVLLPRPLTMIVMMPIMGRLYNYLNPRIPVIAGRASCRFTGSGSLAHFPLAVGFANFAPMLVLMGLGSSCFAVTIGTISLSTMRRGRHDRRFEHLHRLSTGVSQRRLRGSGDPARAAHSVPSPTAGARHQRAQRQLSADSGGLPSAASCIAAPWPPTRMVSA